MMSLAPTALQGLVARHPAAMLKIRKEAKGFSGSLPREVWLASRLKELSVGCNLTGSIPDDYDVPMEMIWLDLTDSLISGTMPAPLCNRSGAVDFDCSYFLCGCDCPC